MSEKIGIYVRVSTHEQAREGYSIDTQIRLLELYCQSQGWTNFKIYSDPGHSAKDMNRPQLKQLHKDIEDKKITILLVYKLDRLTRSVRDLFDILSFLENNNCTFKSATEPYDTTTAMGRMFIGLVGLLAQWERENLGERVAVNMKEKVLVKNEASGIQPYGYKIVEKKRVIDEDEKEVILLMIDLYKRYGSMATVAQELNKRGIPNRLRKGKRSIWRHQTVRQILRNPALCGTLVYDDEIIEDAFEGIISKEEFSKLSRQIERQNIIRLKSPTRGLFSGMLKCPHCKSILVKSEKRYRCNNCYESGNNFFAVSENGIEKGFIEYFKGMTIQPTESVAKKKTRSIESEIKRLEEKRKKFQQMYTDEFMTYAEFQESMKENNQAIAALQDELLTESEELSYEELKEYRWYIVENYELLTREEKIEFTNMFIKEISFKQIVTLYNKNGSPFRYKYIVDNVVFK